MNAKGKELVENEAQLLLELPFHIKKEIIILAQMHRNVSFLHPSHYSVSETVYNSIIPDFLCKRGNPEQKEDKEKHLPSFEFISVKLKMFCIKWL